MQPWYTIYRDFIVQSIENYINTYFEYQMTPPLEDFTEMVIYALKWWKKLRAILALESYLFLTEKHITEISPDDDIIHICVALEMMHAYSLVHDDLPCMDNDVLRRGEPTVWKKYGETNAVLVGDMLNTLTFECISQISDPELVKELITLISHSVWYYGMLGGQVEDMYYEHHIRELTPEILRELHNKKTGKLIQSALLSWVIVAWKTSYYDSFWELGKLIGLAFQIQDDILDIEWTPEETGKSVGWEHKWFVYLLWLEKSKEFLQETIWQAQNLAEDIWSEKIQFLVNYIATRKK